MCAFLQDTEMPNTLTTHWCLTRSGGKTDTYSILLQYKQTYSLFLTEKQQQADQQIVCVCVCVKHLFLICASSSAMISLLWTPLRFTC